METTLRPLTLGEILDRTAELYRSTFLLLAGISSVYAGILLVLGLVQIGVQRSLSALHMNSRTDVVARDWDCRAVLAIFVAAGLLWRRIRAPWDGCTLGEPASIGAAYRSVLPRTGRYVWLLTIIYFYAWFPCVLLYAGYAALILTTCDPRDT